MKKFIIEYKIEWIGEEFNDNICRDKNIEESTVKKIAGLMDVYHDYCDPTKEERAILGIGENDRSTFMKDNVTSYGLKTDLKWQSYEFPRRENFRLSKIKPQNYNNILFVCGGKHKCTFKPLLEKNGYEVKILGEYPEERICISDKNSLLS